MNLFMRILERLGYKAKESKPAIAGRQIPSGDEQTFIASAMALSKWGSAEFYGPGALAAEARRRRTLGLEPEEEAPMGTIRHDVRPD